jgi:hypothetical protein
MPVTLSEPVNVTVTVNYGSVEAPGYASWPEDYDPVLATLTFLPGETAKTIPVTIRGDTLDEPDETAVTQFAAASHAAIGGFGLGGVTIVDDDAPVMVSSALAPSQAEGNSGTAVVQVPVTLSGPSGQVVTVQYAPYSAAGFAQFPADFDAPTGTLTFQPGETSKTIPLTVKGDTLDEPDETALITLSSPTNATLGGFGLGGVAIVDDD